MGKDSKTDKNTYKHGEMNDLDQLQPFVALAILYEA
jgi:hypothetical protein